MRTYIWLSKIIILQITILLFLVSSAYSSGEVSVEDIFVASYDIHTKISKDNYELNEDEKHIVGFFMATASYLEKKKVVGKGYDEETYLPLVFKSIYTLGSALKKVQSDQEANVYADKLIRYGRSIVSDEPLTNPEWIAIAVITQVFRNP